MFDARIFMIAAIAVFTAALAAQAPELDVTRASTAIPDGGSDMPPGTVTAGAAFPLSYTLANTGSATLNIAAAGVSALNNCSVTVTMNPAATVAPAGSTFFNLSVTPTLAGVFSFDASIANDDPNENPYNWTFSGTATGGGGSGGGGSSSGGGGCSTGETQARLALLAALAMLVCSARAFRAASRAA